MNSVENKDKDNTNAETKNKYLQRTNSFSKEFILLKDESEKQKDDVICQSTREINQISKMEEKVLDKPKEILPTIFYEKIKKQTSCKGLKISLIAGQKDIKNLSDMTNALNQNENTNAINKDDFLQIRQIPKVSNEQYEKIRKEIIFGDNLENIYHHFMNCKCHPLNEMNYHDNIGCLLPLTALLESKYNDDPSAVEEMFKKYNLYEKYIFNYRTIKGDGNCFYRAVIFRYFEIIILNKKIDLLKNIICDIKESFKSNEIISRVRIKFDTILNTYFLKILIIILELLEDDRISDAHYLYVKSINIYPLLDYGLIIYFRYIFYKYIKSNENKLYLETFPIKIGNLLPSKYEKDNCGFLFNTFYYCYLLSMFTDAEKIIIYLTPFVLGINLDIIVFDDNEDEIIKNVNFAGKSEYDFNNDKIFVLNVKGHYELLYSKDDYNKYQSIFQKYTNNDLNNFIPKEDLKIIPMSKTIKKNNNKDFINKYKNERGCNDTSNNNNNDNEYKARNATIIPLRNLKPNNSNQKNDNILRTPNKTRNTTFHYIKENNSNTTNKSPNYQYKYSNIPKYNERINNTNIFDKDKINLLNRTENKQTKNLRIIYENQSQNKNVQNNNNLNNINNGETNYSENIDEESDTKQNIKDSINIKSIDFTRKINDIQNKDKKLEKQNTEKSLQKTEVIKSNDNLKTNNRLSKILISPTKNKESKVNDDKKCQLCSEKYNIKNNNEKIPNLCYNCLKREMINQLYPTYLSFVSTSLASIIQYWAFKSNFMSFIQNELLICNANITIENAIKELYNKKNDKNTSKNESQEMQSLFREIKKKFCIICLNELSDQKYQIPCGCNFCSIEHIKKYFHLKNKIKNVTNYICICSYEYTCPDIYDIGLFFYKHRLFSLKNDAIDLINEYLTKQCCFCSLSIGIEERERIKYKDLENDSNLILGDYTQLTHYLCQSCVMGYNSNEVFFCNICNKSHIYYPKQYL